MSNGVSPANLNNEGAQAHVWLLRLSKKKKRNLSSYNNSYILSSECIFLAKRTSNRNFCVYLRLNLIKGIKIDINQVTSFNLQAGTMHPL